jgi:uracil DNA glycosylase
MLSNDQRAMHVLATTHLQHWRNEGIAFLENVITVNESYMNSFDCQLKWQNAEWRAQTSLRNRIAQRSLSSPKVMQVMFFS